MSKNQPNSKEKVLSHSSASSTRTIARSMVLKNSNLFLLCESDSGIPSSEPHGLGIYLNDCRFVRSLEYRLKGSQPLQLLYSSDQRGSEGVFVFGNPKFKCGREEVKRNSLQFSLCRKLSTDARIVCDEWTVTSRHKEELILPFHLTLDCGFEDVFEIRGTYGRSLKRHVKVSHKKNSVSYQYEGQDGILRKVEVVCDKPIEIGLSGKIRLQLSLQPKTSTKFCVYIKISPNAKRESVLVPKTIDARIESTHGLFSLIETDDSLCNRIVDRSFHDMTLLRSDLKGFRYFAAGVPWFVTLFGRDSILSSYMMLAHNAQIADESVRLLASFQGKKDDAWTDEHPGRILHEFRQGELSNINAIPHQPFYGTVDAPLLYVMLIVRRAFWTGNFQLFVEMKDSIEAALNWAEHNGAKNKFGFITYDSKRENSIVNQGWKDSGNAIQSRDEKMAYPPIAMIEVQGYYFRALQDLARAYLWVGDKKRAQTLAKRALAIKDNIVKAFWLKDEKFPAMALERGNKPLSAIGSNPGHLLWCGAVDKNVATLITERLFKEDMFSGWGIRTLSQNENFYDPESYHNGTVWPHDNAIIAAGLKRYGFDDEHIKVTDGILQTASYFEKYRLRELISGYARASYELPVHYPVACHPQAWAAASVPYLFLTALGMNIDGAHNSIHFRRPRFPLSLSRISFKGLQVGKYAADITLTREKNNAVKIECSSKKIKITQSTLLDEVVF